MSNPLVRNLKGKMINSPAVMRLTDYELVRITERTPNRICSEIFDGKFYSCTLILDENQMVTSSKFIGDPKPYSLYITATIIAAIQRDALTERGDSITVGIPFLARDILKECNEDFFLYFSKMLPICKKKYPKDPNAFNDMLEIVTRIGEAPMNEKEQFDSCSKLFEKFDFTLSQKVSVMKGTLKWLYSIRYSEDLFERENLLEPLFVCCKYFEISSALRIVQTFFEKAEEKTDLLSYEAVKMMYQNLQKNIYLDDDIAYLCIKTFYSIGKKDYLIRLYQDLDEDQAAMSESLSHIYFEHLFETGQYEKLEEKMKTLREVNYFDIYWYYKTSEHLGSERVKNTIRDMYRDESKSAAIENIQALYGELPFEKLASFDAFVIALEKDVLLRNYGDKMKEILDPVAVNSFGKKSRKRGYKPGKLKYFMEKWFSYTPDYFLDKKFLKTIAYDEKLVYAYYEYLKDSGALKSLGYKEYAL